MYKTLSWVGRLVAWVLMIVLSLLIVPIAGFINLVYCDTKEEWKEEMIDLCSTIYKPKSIF